MDKKGGSMKKILLLFLIGLFSIIIFSNCYRVIVNAPPGEKVSLLSETDPAVFRTTKKVWYLFYGLIPLTDNSTAPIIQQYILDSIRADTEFDAVDLLINVFFGYFIGTKTIVIEGNPKK